MQLATNAGQDKLKRRREKGLSRAGEQRVHWLAAREVLDSANFYLRVTLPPEVVESGAVEFDTGIEQDISDRAQLLREDPHD